MTPDCMEGLFYRFYLVDGYYIPSDAKWVSAELELTDTEITTWHALITLIF